MWTNLGYFSSLQEFMNGISVFTEVIQWCPKCSTPWSYWEETCIEIEGNCPNCDIPLTEICRYKVELNFGNLIFGENELDESKEDKKVKEAS